MINLPTLNSIFFGSAFAVISSSSFAAEPPINELEFPVTRKAVCAFNKLSVSTPAEVKECENIMIARKNRKDGQLTDAEKAVAIDAACFERHKTHHISYAQTCKAELREFYKVASAETNTTSSESTAMKSCVKGATIGLGTKLLVHGVALALDFMGCSGACTTAAATWTIPAAGAIAVGCAGGLMSEAIDGQSSSRPNTPPRASPK